MAEKLSNINNVWWNNITQKVKNAVVFVDEGAAECLHWNKGILRLIDGGAIKVLEFSISQTTSVLSVSDDTAKCVFLLTTPLWGNTLETLEVILSSRIFQECNIITSLHPSVHQLAKYGSRATSANLTKDDPFNVLKEQLLTAMGNKKYILEIHYIPMFLASVCSNLFLTPSYADLFPILSSDIGSAHLEKTVLDSMMEATFEELKLETQVQLRGMATNFDSVLDMMNIREDCYSMGCFSRILCNELEQLPSSKLRRKKSCTRAAVLFLDRTLDLSQVSSYDFETLLDKIMHSCRKLPNHTIDVDIDLSPLSFVHKSCYNSDVLVSGSLCNSDAQDNSTLYSMVNDRQKDCIMKINRKLVDACAKEQISSVATGRLSRITAETLLSKVINFRNDSKLIFNHQCLLQHTLATIQTLQDNENTKIDQLLGVEKALTQILAESQSANFALRLAQMIKERKTRSLSVEEILIILVRVCSMKDIFSETNESDDILKAVLGDAMLKDYTELPDYLKSAIGPEVDEWTIHTITAKIFKVLHAVSNSRGDLKKYKSIYNPGNSTQPAVCVPLIKQLLDDVYDTAKPELVDLECKSTGLKDMLKSSLSLFLNVNKPRPADCPILMIFIIGGVTTTEMRHIKEQIALLSSNTEVLVGSTRLSLPKDTLKLVLSDLKSIS